MPARDQVATAPGRGSRITRPIARLARRLLVVTAALAVVVVVSVPGRADEHDPPPPARVAPLDGAPLTADEAEVVLARRPVAVVLDNLPDGARPQIGLAEADLVYEFLVEGGITRFLAVYLRRESRWIEPVRSVRTPFLYLVKELDAVLAHVGAAETEGDANAGGQMADWGINHIEERDHPAAFWRDRSRRAPHNAVTETAAVRAEAEARGWGGPGAVSPWLFGDELTVRNRSVAVAGHAGYAFALAGGWQRAFAVDWYYDPSINGYRRWLGGAPHRDGLTGEQLSAKNVIVQFDSAAVVDHEGHVLYGSTGDGPAYIFLDSQVIAATWVKPTPAERTRYYDRDGEEIRFNRGPTWVALLPSGSPLTWD